MRKELFKISDSINTISDFLAMRSIPALCEEQLLASYGFLQADMLILLGSSIVYAAELAAQVYTRGLAKQLMIVGGVGHSTHLLREAVSNSPAYPNMEVEGKTEADIFSQIVSHNSQVSRQELILERESTNCGNNATFALELMKEWRHVPQSIILIQDPTMQRRTAASFRKAWEGRGNNVTFISFAPFVPKVMIRKEKLVFDGLEQFGQIWGMERFLSLIMGEIPRIRDDENGYGPHGKNFIAHVDIPEPVHQAYEQLLPCYGDFIRFAAQATNK